MRNIGSILANVCGPYVSDPSSKLFLMDQADIVFAASGISINHLTNSIRDHFFLQGFLVVARLETNFERNARL